MKKQENKKSIAMKIDRALLEYVDEYAEKNGISRAGAINIMIGQYRQSVEGLKALNDFVQAYKEGKNELGNK